MSTNNITKRITQEVSVAVSGVLNVSDGDWLFDNGSGYVVTTPAANLFSLGRAKGAADNSSGASGDLDVVAQRGCFHLSMSTAITQADIGKKVYATTVNNVFALVSGSIKTQVGVIDSVGLVASSAFVDTDIDTKRTNE